MNQLIRSDIFHKRYLPKENSFTYGGIQVLVNIDDLDDMKIGFFGLNRFNLMSLSSRDHAYKKSHLSLSKSYRQWAEEKLQSLGMSIKGEIILQTIPRILGYVFNPVSFWYCYEGSAQEGDLKAVICEVNNTFGESHNYVLDIEKGETLKVSKDFHVSPFYPRTGDYHFRFDGLGNVLIQYDDDGVQQFIATIKVKEALPLNRQNIFKILLRNPLFTFVVVFLIHWQALIIFIKKAKFYTKPEPLSQEDTYGSNNFRKG